MVGGLPFQTYARNFCIFVKPFYNNGVGVTPEHALKRIPYTCRVFSLEMGCVYVCVYFYRE